MKKIHNKRNFAKCIFCRFLSPLFYLGSFIALGQFLKNKNDDNDKNNDTKDNENDKTDDTLFIIR